MEGGFMSQPAGQQEEKKSQRAKQTLVPSTIKMCLEASLNDDDESVEIDGRYSTQVRIVGTILRADARETRIAYEFEDGTGKIDGTVFANAGDDLLPMLKEKRDKCVPGTYVVVVGQVKEYHGKKNLRCYDVRPMTDFNELTHHFLEVIYQHAKSKKQPVQASAQASWGGATTRVAPQQQQAPMDVDQQPANGLTVNQNRVLDYYNRNGTTDEGCNAQDVINAMAGHMSSNDAQDAINVLLADGFLYSTIDDTYHKSTDSC